VFVPETKEILREGGTPLHARTASLAAALFILASTAGAQQFPSQARGLSANVTYQGGQVGRVNLFNGGLTIPLALGQRYSVGPALSYGITLVNTSNVWDCELQTCATTSGTERYYLPDVDPKTNAGAGWRIQLGKLIPPGGPGGRWHLLGSDGSESGFYPELHPGHGGQNEVFFSNNGTYRRLRLSNTECQAVAGTPAACRLLESAGGTVQEFHDFGTAAESDWRLTRIRDRFANFVDVTYSTGGNFGAGDIRSATVDYNSDNGTLTVLDVDQSLLGGNFQLPGPNEPWVLNTFRESRVSEGGQTAVEEFCFDEDTGALERHRSLAGTARASGDLLQVMTRDAAGFVTREDLYGGDLQGPMDNVYGDLCEMSLTALDTQYLLEHTWRHGSLESSHWIDPCDGSLVLTTVDDSIDLSTGLVSVSRDVSGIGTTLVYDALGRPTGEQPASGAWLEVDYRMPTTSQPNLSPQVTTSACSNGVTGCTNAQLLSWLRVEYDGLGRAVEESQRIPGTGGLVLEERRSTWNAMGWPLTQSVWGDFSQVVEWSGHDRFGRPGEVRLPGEMPTRFTYHGDRAVTREVRIATGANGEESPAFTTEVYGGQGRLVSLCENQATAWTGTCQGIETRYEYLPQGALTRVCQNTSGSSCGQERLFDVDGRGFLLGEKHPEIGPSGNGWTTYARDALGNPTLRTIAGDSSFNLGFHYDAAGRLIRIEELAVPRLLKEFSYARSNFGASQGKGKLYQAKRHNWVDPVTPLENVTGSLDLSGDPKVLLRGARRCGLEAGDQCQGPRDHDERIFAYTCLATGDGRFGDPFAPTIPAGVSPQCADYTCQMLAGIGQHAEGVNVLRDVVIAATASGLLGQYFAATESGLLPAVASQGGGLPVRIGQARERAVRAVFDLGERVSIRVAGRTRIPDGISRTALSEVKNVKSLSYTSQLRDYATFARQEGLRFDLYVRTNTKLSGPLFDAIKRGLINLRYIP